MTVCADNIFYRCYCLFAIQTSSFSIGDQRKKNAENKNPHHIHFSASGIFKIIKDSDYILRGFYRARHKYVLSYDSLIHRVLNQNNSPESI